MALRPEQIREQLSTEDEMVVSKIEAFVDRSLTADYEGSGTFQVDLLPTFGRLRLSQKNALMSKYRAAGWQVAFNEGSCQRDGSWCYLVLGPAEEGPREPGSAPFL